jgi:hypothetical protein
MKNILFGIIILIIVSCSSIKRISVCDDCERIRSLSILIKDYNMEFMRYGVKNDSSGMKKMYDTIQELESNRMLLLKRCLKEKDAKINEEIIVDSTTGVIRWNDENEWKAGDCFIDIRNDKYGVLVSNSYMNNLGELYYFSHWGDRVGMMDKRYMRKVNEKDVDENILKRARIFINKMKHRDEK